MVVQLVDLTGNHPFSPQDIRICLARGARPARAAAVLVRWCFDVRVTASPRHRVTARRSVTYIDAINHQPMRAT